MPGAAPTPSSPGGQTGIGGGGSAVRQQPLSFGELKAAWIRNGGNPAAAPIAAAVAMAESGGNVNAINHNSDGSIDRGPWQVNSVHGDLSQTGDVDQAARAAIKISNNGANWNPWVTFKNGAFRKFLNAKDSDTTGYLNESDTAHAVEGGLNAIPDGLKAIGAFLAKLVDPKTWLHVLEVVGGVILLVMGLRVLTGNSALPPLSTIAKAA